MNNRSRTLALGALLGAVTGLVGAMLLTRRAEQEGTELAITAGDGMKIGVMVVGLLRAIAALGDDNN
jgi:hypothetical protein